MTTKLWAVLSMSLATFFVTTSAIAQPPPFEYIASVDDIITDGYYTEGWPASEAVEVDWSFQNFTSSVVYYKVRVYLIYLGDVAAIVDSAVYAADPYEADSKTFITSIIPDDTSPDAGWPMYYGIYVEIYAEIGDTSPDVSIAAEGNEQALFWADP